MAKTKLDTKGVQRALKTLGYYDGKVDGDYLDANYRSDLKRFQRDVRPRAGVVDGWYGRKTEAVLLPMLAKITESPICGFEEMRRWFLTYYYVADEAEFSRRDLVPVVDPKGKHLATVPARFFASMALEGTGKLRDGRLLNVATNPSQRRCDPKVFEPVFRLAQRNGWIPKKPGYAGIRTDGKKATHARTFYQISERRMGLGYGVLRGIALQPFKTLATDIGRLRKHDPKWKKKGGVIVPKTRVYILEFDGMALPNGETHDGWFQANDTGGGIYGAHIDVFTGTRKWAKAIKDWPSKAHIWFEGIETKIDMNYTYGLD
jgi:hypothetical protein